MEWGGERGVERGIEIDILEVIKDDLSTIRDELITHPGDSREPLVVPSKWEVAVGLKPSLDTPTGRFRDNRGAHGVRVAIPGSDQRP